MSEPISLSGVPGKFLDQHKWRSVRRCASQEIIALSYINAPYPDENDPREFFFDRRGTEARAIQCYWTGRSLLADCRALLNRGHLIATGIERKTGRRKVIPSSEWLNLWPMFVTNKAVGPRAEYEEVKVVEATSSATPHAELFSVCIAWLKQQRQSGVNNKKSALYGDARRSFGEKQTHAIFDAAYLAVFSRQRGRPKKNTVKS